MALADARKILAPLFLAYPVVFRNSNNFLRERGIELERPRRAQEVIRVVSSTQKLAIKIVLFRYFFDFDTNMQLNCQNIADDGDDFATVRLFFG